MKIWKTTCRFKTGCVDLDFLSPQQIYDERKKGASLYKNASEMGEKNCSQTEPTSSEQQPHSTVLLKVLWIVSSISVTLQFDATPSDVDYFTADVTFKYTYYEVQT